MSRDAGTGRAGVLARLGLSALEGAKGGAKFLEAIRAGDWADDAAVEARRARCRACPSRVRRWGSDWCGEPLTATDRTCGCLVYGKTLVGSEACPQGQWGAVETRGDPETR